MKADFEGAVERMRNMPIPDDYKEPRKFRDPAEVLAEMGVPKRVLRYVFGVLEPTAAIKAVNDWVCEADSRQTWSLVLAAPVGVGKTVAAGHWLALVNSEIPSDKTGARAGWITSSELAVTDIYGDQFGRLKRARTLVIDDLGTEFLGKSGAFFAKLDPLINERYSHERLTLITTNLNAKDFKERMPDRVVSRLRDGGVWAQFAGESMR